MFIVVACSSDTIITVISCITSFSLAFGEVRGDCFVAYCILSVCAALVDICAC